MVNALILENPDYRVIIAGCKNLYHSKGTL